MIRRPTSQASTAALAGLALLSAPAALFAQTGGVMAGPGSRPRTTDARTTTEAATPPPVNSDYRRAAEGTLPLVPGQTGTVGAAIDPAARPLGNTTATPGGAAVMGALPAGLAVAMLINHAVEMAIEGSTLAGLAAANKPGDAGNDSVQALLKHAQEETAESKQLLARAAAAGNQVDANSPVRRFYGAANNYLSTLAQAATPGMFESPNDKAQVAMINHAVKSVLDGNKLAQLGAIAGPSAALDPLVGHARLMKDEGMKALDTLGGTSPIDPSSPPTTAVLAQRGRDLVLAAGALGPMVPQALGFGGAPAGLNAGGLPNPGRLQDTRPLIPGGTFGTGDPTQQTATGAEAAANVRNGTEGPNGTLNVPIPTGAPGTGPSGYGVGNNNTPPTNSTAGSRPR